ncbi:hypothetical protein P4679_27660 [Priestia megaterium]|uniref:hypothetical protein n=1 Tax=Priestia megaterium TaxID=1404 RepID=UPI002E1A0E91|nr:hypothetical protein [Priestia megaterium]
MSKISMKEILTETFKDDILWRQIHNLNLEEHLFPESLLKELHLEDTYYTAKAATILGLPDNNAQPIRNNLAENRKNVREYVQATRTQKQWTFDYKSLFRMHMYFILNLKGKMSPKEISHYLGNEVEEIVTERMSRSRNNVINEKRELSGPDKSSRYDERLERIENQLIYQSRLNNLLTLQREYEEANRKVTDWELLMELVNYQLEIAEMKRRELRSEKKQLQLFKESFKKFNEINENNRPSLLKVIFSKNTAHTFDHEETFAEVAAASEVNLDGESPSQELTDINQEIEELKQKKKSIENEKESLTRNKKLKKEAYENFKKQLDFFEKKLNTTSFVEESLNSKMSDSVTIEYKEER